MTSGTYVSYAQNREDVVLHRALRSITGGHYVEVGANDPTLHSISRGFYELGWNGLTIDPVHEFIEAHQAARPRDTQVEAAITDADTDEIVLHQISGTGLSTLDDETGARHHESGWATEDVRVPARRLDEVLQQQGWKDTPIHFLVVDVEGAEDAVLASIDLTAWRPWILVIEATRPLSTEPAYMEWEPRVLAADYRFKLFDGLSRFYLAAEHEEELGALLSYPACVHDDYVEHSAVVESAERDRLLVAATELTTALESATADRDKISADRDAVVADREQIVADRNAIAADREQIVASAAESRREDTDAIIRWRSAALGAWSHAAVAGSAGVVVAPVDTSEELVFLRNHTHAVTNELAAMKQTVSWRVTRPLRVVRRLGKLVGR